MCCSVPYINALNRLYKDVGSGTLFSSQAPQGQYVSTYITRVGWHEIQVSSTSLGVIVAQVYTRAQLKAADPAVTCHGGSMVSEVAKPDQLIQPSPSNSMPIVSVAGTAVRSRSVSASSRQ